MSSSGRRRAFGKFMSYFETLTASADTSLRRRSTQRSADKWLDGGVGAAYSEGEETYAEFQLCR